MKFIEIDNSKIKEIVSLGGYSILSGQEIEVIDNYDDYLLVCVVDTSLYIEYDGEWTLFFSFEYGPLDTYAIMSIEQNAINAYINLKYMLKCENHLMFCKKIEDYPHNEIRVGVEVINICDDIVIQILFDWYNIISEDAYYVHCLQELKDALSIQEYLLLSNELIWLKYIDILHAGGFNNNGPVSLESQYIKEGDIIQVRDNVQIDFEEKNFKELTIGFEVGDFLVLTDKNYKYVVRKYFYNTLKKLVDELLNPFEDLRGINVYLDDNMELVYVNSVFFGMQKNITVANDIKSYMDYEIMRLEERIYDYSGKLYVNKANIVNGFEALLRKEKITEKEIQKYIEANYKLLLGKKYDDIRSEVNIVDQSGCISEISRRIDIAVHDSVVDNWDIYELKLPHEKCTIKTRDIISFTSEVNKAINQVLLYKELLSQVAIQKDMEEKYKVKITHPQYYLLIGMQNDDGWKKCTSDEKRIMIKSYEQVIKEARIDNAWI